MRGGAAAEGGRQCECASAQVDRQTGRQAGMQAD